MTSTSLARTALVGGRVARAAEVVDAATVSSYLARVSGPATGTGVVDVVAPATGEVVGRVPGHDPGDVAALADRARTAQQHWAARPVAERAGVLLAVHDLLARRRESLTDVVQLVTGKSRADAFLEVVNALQVTRHLAVRGPRALRPERRPGFVPGATQVLVRPVPAGVVGNIAAWNYPLVFVLGDTVPALLAGNAALVKPDPRSLPLAGAVLGLLRDAGVPDGLVQVLAGGSAALGEAVVDHSDHVLFTGSEAVGRRVGARAAARLIGCTLELGGKNAMYIAADADVERTAAAAVRDCFGAAGQTCTSSERVYVHAAVAEEITAAFVRRTAALRLGWGRDHESDVGSLVSPEHLDRVLAHVDDATARGARVLVGGHARPELGPSFMEPTVLVDVPPGARCAQEETFGPVVALHVVADDEAALAAIADTDTGLVASIWSRDVPRAQALAARVRTGTVVVNETHQLAWASPAAPLGGLGVSGLGRRYGREGLAEVTRSQVVLTQRTSLVSRVADAAPARRDRLLVGATRLLRGLRLP